VSVAQNLQTQLDTYKFRSVQSTNGKVQWKLSTIVSFSSSVGQDVRNAVLRDVKKDEANVYCTGKTDRNQ